MQSFSEMCLLRTREGGLLIRSLQCSTMKVFSIQVLDQVSPKPTDVSRNKALQYKHKNHTMDFLPSEQLLSSASSQALV